MKITLFTSNNTRHNFFINLLSEISDELFVVQECNTIFTGIVPNNYPSSEIMQNYFTKVNDAQSKLFGNAFISNKSNNLRILPILGGDLNKCSPTFLSEFLKSDIYIVFGSSYIRGSLIDYLIEKKTFNIHMGVSPYYRGTDCNFWALKDQNPHLVGSTIHMLSKGLDSGSVLYHAMSNIKSDPFIYTMSTVKSAFYSIVERIKNESIFQIKPEKQDKSLQVRYSKKIDFNENVIQDYLSKKVDLSKKFDNSLLKDPFFLDN
jgi:hypothetical protein